MEPCNSMHGIPLTFQPLQHWDMHRRCKFMPEESDMEGAFCRSLLGCLSALRCRLGPAETRQGA